MKRIICLMLLFLNICLFVPPTSYAEDDSVKTNSSSIENEKRVMLRVQVLKDGSSGEILVKESSGDESLDNKAIKLVKNWSFVPAKDSNGEPMECYVKVPITFRPAD